MAVRSVCGGGGVLGGWDVVCFRSVRGGAGQPVVAWKTKERRKKC